MLKNSSLGNSEFIKEVKDGQQMDTVYWFFPSHLSYRCKSHMNCRYKHVKQYKNKWKGNFIFTESSCVINITGKKLQSHNSV